MAGTAVYLALGAGASYFVVRSAKHKLAKFIAHSVSSVLDVDPEQIESGLVKSGNLALNQVRLKPQEIAPGASLVGEIAEIRFKWSWGKSIVKDAQVSVEGANLRIVISEEDVVSPPPDTTTTSSSSWSDAKPKQTNEDDVEVGGTVQQILDDLSISMSNVKLTIETKASIQEVKKEQQPLNVVVQFQSLSLKSLGREQQETATASEQSSQPALLETMHLQSFCAFLAESGGGSALDKTQLNERCLVEPFGYKASIKRVSGQRFVSTIETGLEIVGQVITTEQGIKMHMGTTQVQVLLKVMELLNPPVTQEDQGMEEQVVATTTTKATADNSTGSSLLVLLPIPQVSLILPNSTISTHNWEFRFRADYSECSLQGTGPGVYVNEGNFRLVQFEDNAMCAIDLRGNNIVLNHDMSSSSGMPGIVAHVHWKEREMKPLLDELKQMAALAYPADNDGSNDSKTKKKQKTMSTSSSSSTSTPWSLSVDGTISGRIEGGEEEEEWMEASLDAPCFVLPERPDELPSQVSFRGATFGPTSFGNISIRMSSATLSTKAVRETVLDDMSKFVFRVLGITSS